MESAGWFEWFESGFYFLSFRSFAQIFELLLSSTAAAAGFQDMGRKTFLLSLLGLLLISCKCDIGPSLRFSCFACRGFAFCKQKAVVTVMDWPEISVQFLH